MFRHQTLACLIAAHCFAAPALAQSPAGLWLTQPDKKGQVAHVEATRCGNGYCGKIVRVFAANGQPVNAPTVGRRVFWDMIGQGGSYSGQAHVPAHNRNYAGRMQVSGNTMTVSGCLGPVCQSQTWKRVR